jgi:M6 family metalloprotease-like protein
VKEMRKRFLLFVIFFVFAVVQNFPQSINQIVCETTTVTEPGSTTYGLYKPAQTASGEYFRVLIVYAQFASDNLQDSEWPLNQLPGWANNIVSTNVSSSYPEQTLSDYFDKGSLGKYDFIGDVYPNLIIVPTNMSYGNANQYVISQLNNSISDFSRYDNWKLQNGSFIFSESNGDGYLDMLIIVYRWADKNWFFLAGGIAELGFSYDYTTHDGIKINGRTSTIGSGITTKAGLKGKFDMVGHLAHEFGHYLFGGGHTSLGGLMMGEPYPYFGSYMMNAWERAKLGYITPTIPVIDGETISLDDFVNTGDAIKIPVPFNDPNSSTYFLVENHKRESIYDQIMRGGSLNGSYNFTTTLGSGIYVWVITFGNIYAPIINIKSADGSWNWQYVGDYYAGPGWYDDKPWAGYLPETIRSSVNRETGKSDRWAWNIYWNNHYASKWVDVGPTGQWSITRNCMGDETDPFNIGYNELLTPWSNPSSYINGTTNISMKLLDNNTVKIYSSIDSALSLPPSKPQNLKLTIANNHPVLTWEANIESDLAGYNIYRTENGLFTELIGYVTKKYRTFTDYSANTSIPSDNYGYTIKAKDNSALLSVSSDKVSIMALAPKISVGSEEKMPSEYILEQNHPNPFNPTTLLNYSVKEAGLVKIKVYDVLGSEIAELVNEIKEAGYHSVEFNASNLPSGVYIYTLQVNGYYASQKMLLLK